MKVHIGPYLTWWGPYQIADLLQYVGVSEDRCHLIGEWLNDTWVGDVCKWIHDRRHRKIKVHIDYYDIWSMDHTLAHIILPMLKMLKDKKHGSPYVDDEDVPENLRSTAAPPKKEEWDTDDNFHDRWTWVLDEMIWSFGTELDEDEEHKQLYDPYEPGEEVKPSSLPFDTVEFRTKLGKYNKEKADAFYKRKANGFRLFGKYYQGLWD
jgi:hypothetical protein